MQAFEYEGGGGEERRGPEGVGVQRALHRFDDSLEGVKDERVRRVGEKILRWRKELGMGKGS